MTLHDFIDRDSELTRMTTALRREAPQFIVVYGRRRIGKSTLIREVLSRQQSTVYFLADRTTEVQQRRLFSAMADEAVPGFSQAAYDDWESLLRALSRQAGRRIVVCMDEFPYLAKSCPSLPSVLQKLLNERALTFDLIICGSSQQLMQGYVLDRREPLYGLSDEIMRIRPIPARYTQQAIGCDAVAAVAEYAVWGGVPRYWELRRDHPSLMAAVRALMLDPNGFMIDEPQRLLRDDMRDSVQTETLLSIIGNGANRISEIAARAGRNAAQLTEPLARLRELGYVRRDVPFGEDDKKSKRGVYHIADSLFRFLYRFVIPYRSVIQLGHGDVVAQVVEQGLPQYVGECWEQLCRDHVSGNIIDGVAYNVAGRWWGKVFPDGDKEGQMVELDVVAESIDHRHIIIGECKWTADEDASRLMSRLEHVSPLLPFVKRGQTVHHLIFTKHPPLHAADHPGQVLLPEDVLGKM